MKSFKRKMGSRTRFSDLQLVFNCRALKHFLCASVFCAIACAVQANERPNIVFVLADDLGWQDTSVPFAHHRTAWNDRYRTPAMERLAREGRKFTQAYACTVCSPTRVSLFTGMNQARHGVHSWTHLRGDEPITDRPHATLSHAAWNWNGLQPDGADIPHSVTAPTLPTILQKAGYRTLHFGKGHFGAADTPGADPQVFGFDVRIGGRYAGGLASYSGLQNFGAKKIPKVPWRAWDLDHYFGKDIHLTEALTQEASREIRTAVNAKQPFFCYFAHYAPHVPIQPDERFASRYREAGLDGPEAAYASLIEGMDKSLGDLLDLIDELGIADNTLVVFMSDNGGVSHAYRSMAAQHSHNSPLSSGKGSHHEGGIRVPLVVRWPGVTQPESQCDTPVIIYDWFTTLLAAAGVVASKQEVDGLDLTPLLRGESADQFDRSLVWHYPVFWGGLTSPSYVQGPGMGPSSTIRRDHWKLIYYHDGQRMELFNLDEDLSEKQNLVAEHPDIVSKLSIELSEYLETLQAPMPMVKSTNQSVALPHAAITN
jgi:arylsulfatase A-like enzyme